MEKIVWRYSNLLFARLLVTKLWILLFVLEFLFGIAQIGDFAQIGFDTV